MTYLSLAKQYRLLFFPNTLARSLVWELKCKLLVLQQYPQKFFILCISSASFHLCYFRTVKSELIVFIKRHVRTAVRQQSGKWASLNAPIFILVHCSSPLPYRTLYLWTVHLPLLPMASIPLISRGHCTSSLSILDPSGFVSPTNLIMVETASKECPTKKMWSSCRSERKAIVYSSHHEKSFCKCSSPEAPSTLKNQC